MKPGDLVRMLPKNYSSPGHYVPDQWKGLIGMVTEVFGTNEELAYDISYAVFIKHPDDSVPTEIFISRKDVEVISES